MNNIRNILEGVYSNLELRESVVPLFMGNPGIGKTEIIKQFAKDKGVNLIEFITSQRNPFEISGLAYPDKELKRMSYWDFDTLLNAKDGDILFFDEIFNGNPIVLNACLTILEGRTMISGKKLPKIMIVAAANYQGMCPLTPQIKERFIWYDIKFSPSMWKTYVIDKFNLDSNIATKLSKLISDEKFDGLNSKDNIVCNFNSARSITKNINLIVNGINTPYEERLLPILNTLIENPLNETVDLGNGETLEPKEMISWLRLIRLGKNIPIDKNKIFKIPEFWYIEVTLENFDEVHSYFRKTYGGCWSKAEGFAVNTNTNNIHSMWEVSENRISDYYTKINIEQFRTYISNEQI